MPKLTTGGTWYLSGLIAAMLSARALGAPDAPDPSVPGPLTIHSVGEYGGVPWTKPGVDIPPASRQDRVKDLNLAVSSVNLKDAMSEALLRRWANAATCGREQGKQFLPRVYFWDGRDRFTGAVRDIEVYWKRLDTFLAAMPLEDFYGIVLAEENVASRSEILSDLYRRVKATYDVRVYQWWSPASRVPNFLVPADGWVVDIYSYGGKKFRRYVQRYLMTGKPLVVMPYAAWMRGEEAWPDSRWEILEDQLHVCREYNLSTAFYWVHGVKGRSGGVHFGISSGNFMARINQRIFDWIEDVRALPPDYDGLPSADRSSGELLEIGPDENGKFTFQETFQTSRFVLDSDTDGFRNLLWTEDRTLNVRSWKQRKPAASLTYNFAGDFPAESPHVSLDVVALADGSTVTLSLSHDGTDFSTQVTASTAGAQSVSLATDDDPRFASCTAFSVRVAVEGARTDGSVVAKIDNLNIGADLTLPAEPVVKLTPDPEKPDCLVFSDDFQTRTYLATTTASPGGNRTAD